MTNIKDNDISEFIAAIRDSVVTKSPDLKEYFEIYANEAMFGWSIIRDEVSRLKPGSAVMEIGAGLLILSGYLSNLGIAVHALEPIAGGFSHFQDAQNLVREYYKKVGLKLIILDLPIEEFKEEGIFDYIYSINVFEHIASVESGLSNAYSSLKYGGMLRIYCPNYHFPYEPHFNIPTLINKRYTEIVFKNSIVSSNMPSAQETWDALNWINISQVRKLFISRFDCNPCFNKNATYQIFERAIFDQQFAARR